MFFIGINEVAISFAEGEEMSERSRAKYCSPWFAQLCAAWPMCGKETSLLKAFFATRIKKKGPDPSGSNDSQNTPMS